MLNIGHDLEIGEQIQCRDHKKGNCNGCVTLYEEMVHVC